MNREQRRMEKRLAKVKPNRSRAIYVTNFQLEHESFDSIERMFQQIRNGALNYVQAENAWVIMGLAGDNIDVLYALNGWMKYWQELTERQGIEYDDSAMVKLAKSLEYHKPMHQSLVDDAYKVLERQRQLYRSLPKSVTTKVAKEVTVEIARTTEVRELMGVT